MSFRVEAPYQPTGDQPRAIAQIVEGVEKGYKHQTLLGATATGKSTCYSTPVYIVEQRGGQRVARLTPIGPLIDSLMAANAERLRSVADTQILDGDSQDVAYYVQAFNPETCAVGLYPVSAFTRHTPPEQMYYLETACGRSVTLTGDHNLWVLRDGRLQLIETADARPTDCIPLPELLMGEGNLQALDTLAFVPGDRVYVHADASLSTFLAQAGPQAFRKSISSGGRDAEGKLHAIRHNKKGSGIEVRLFRQLLQDTDNLRGSWDPSAARLGGKVGRSGFCASLPFTSELLRFIGYYIAEGHAEYDYIVVANRDEGIRQVIEAAVAQVGLTCVVAPSTDYRIFSTAFAGMMKQLCGSDSRSKRLPSFWTQLSNADLALILQAYFDGDGTVDRAYALSATTASKQLASDLAYALLRFGIWARIARVRKRATNSNHAGDWYYRITVSGQSDLKRFASQIGFTLGYKQAALIAHLGRDESSNVDLVPIDGAKLRWLRTELGLPAREIGALARLSRAGVQMIETGKRAPQRSNLVSILEALRLFASDVHPSDAWWQTWWQLRSLCGLRWTPIASVTPVEYEHPYVYDFTVPGAETFLAGDGGLFVHNTFVMSKVFEQLKRPALVMAHNKTLVSQLYAEFRELLPDAAVELFISYYDVYTPEAYVPSKDLYIEKEAQINEEIDRLRHAATQALLTRPDVLIVASVSAIYGLGSPHDYGQVVIPVRVGEVRNRDKLMRQLIDLQFERNDIDFHRGTFRVRGDTLDVFPANAEVAERVEFWGDEVERIVEFDPLTGEVLLTRTSVDIYPAKHFITTGEKLQLAIADISQELTERVKELEEHGKLLEAARVKQRTMYDLEMLGEVGYCSGIENYSRHMDRRSPGQTPWTLLDYFPDDFILFVDESHISLPQIRGMFNGDRSRKETLVDYGFRLPSALDNRPLRFEEFEQHVHQAIYVSATPGPYELEHSAQVVEQIIRPTGLIDPVIHVRPSKGQIDDLLGEVRQRVNNGQRALVTTLTKRMAEDLADYLKEMGVRTHYLHSDIETLERVEILRDLRLGVYDVVVGINLLREGLDLPEVSLVAILDADKEGFLRSGSSLIQITGRAARHIDGTVIMYADTITRSMREAIQETDRRRAIQEAHNRLHNITPVGISKGVKDLTDRVRKVAEEREVYKAGAPLEELPIPKDEIVKLIKELEKQMKTAARDLEFEKAAGLRDQIVELRRTLALAEETA
jgi:excinuclease ABC subunit B